MITIQDLLARFNSILVSSETTATAVREVIKETTGISLEKKDVRIKHGIVYIVTKPLYRTEIFLHKETIIKKLKNMLGATSPYDIR